MRSEHSMVPHLTTANSHPLHDLEKIILKQAASIEAWFRQEWQKTPPPITSSVDLRNAGFKLSPVDTNLFPAGFNNLNPDFMPLCVQAAQSVLIDIQPSCRRILLLPENHTRNRFYLQSLQVLKDIFMKAGFDVRIGSLDPDVHEVNEVEIADGEHLRIEPLIRQGNRLELADFKPCLLLLNNDLSTGVPDILQGLSQNIKPSEQLGWFSRLKSQHFDLFAQVATEFSEITGIDPWFIKPYSSAVEAVDFMAVEGIDRLTAEVDKLLIQIRQKYQEHAITDKPFVVIKADNGTYGMSVMMVQDASEIQQLNRKQRTKMSATKGSQKVDRVLIQEGVYTFETMEDGSVAEPVIYMIGQFVVGGFYRVHQGRGKDENLNAPGMYFEPLAFVEPCNTPCPDRSPGECVNRFYSYGVIARLAALAAAREQALLGVS
jgi:glutamate--cysteine ligase